jgi:hypothetical protein
MSKPTIRILQPGDETALEAFLLSRVESSMFLIGNMRASGLIDNGQACAGTYAAALKDKRVVGVVAHYWNQNKAILFTGESNIAAQKAYAALGFQHIGDYRLVLLKSPLEVV